MMLYKNLGGSVDGLVVSKGDERLIRNHGLVGQTGFSEQKLNG